MDTVNAKTEMDALTAMNAKFVVKKIIHIADIHIRSGNKNVSRYEEYKSVLDNIIVNVKTFKDVQNSIIIIAGDVFHHKLKIESPGIKLILSFLSRLAALAPVYIIRGNHDYRQDFPEEPDLIESLLSIDIPNVTYLNESGHYIIGQNLGIGVVAIQNALQAGNTTGIAPKLPQFPSPDFFDNIPTRLALFHGAVSKTKLPNGMTIEDANSYPLEWFSGYDAVILGDIHLQQVNNARQIAHSESQFDTAIVTGKFAWGTNKLPTFAYAGSTVQQNFGESLVGHGFLLWDLEYRTIECYHIPNPYGFVTLCKTSGNDYNVVLKDQYCTRTQAINDIFKEVWFPHNISVRVLADHHDVDEAFLMSTFKNNNINVEKLTWCPTTKDAENNMTPNNVIPDDIDICQFNTPNVWINYIEGALTGKLPFPSWKEWFHNNESLLIPEPTLLDRDSMLHNKITEKNTKINKRISDYQSIRDNHVSFNSSKKPFTIQYMSWDYILCFQSGNYFNFNNLSGKINLISAKNGLGKTSFLETICIALYGEGFPSRFNKTYSASSVICQTRPKGVTSSTSIVVAIDAVNFKINRKFSIHSSDSNKIHCVPKCITVDREEDGKYINIHSGKTAVDAWVTKHIGSLSAFLLSCMVTQNSDLDFFNMKTQEQKELLDNALAINDSTEFHSVIKETKLAHSSIIDTLNGTISATNKKKDVDALIDAQMAHELRINELIKEKESLGPVKPIAREVEDILCTIKGNDELSAMINELRKLHGVEMIDEINIQDIQIALQTNTNLLNELLRDKPYINHHEKTCHMKLCPKGLVASEIGPDNVEINKAISVVQTSNYAHDQDSVLACLENLSNWHELLKKTESRFQECEKVLKSLLKHPYNPDCWACQTQPWKAIEAEQQGKLSNLKAVKKKVCDKASAICKQPINCANDIMTNIQELEELQRCRKMVEWYDAYVQIEANILLQIQTYQEWEEKVTMLEQDIHLLKEEVKTVTEQKTVKDKIALYEKCIEDYDIFIENRRTQTRLNEITKELIEVNVRLTITKQEYKDAIEHRNTREQLLAYANELQERCSSLSSIYDIFAGFKNWLYAEKIIPYLQSGANKIMMTMCEDRPLSIESKIVSGSLHWFLKDGNVSPPIEKASGFQRFIAGLAMRIALGRFGASGIRALQLFVDEGFTACDCENINKVGSFLENLPYKHIILVSHLDEVKASAHNNITISRNYPSKLSLLQYGSQM